MDNPRLRTRRRMGQSVLGVFEGRSVKTLGSLSGHGGIWLSGVFYGF